MTSSRLPPAASIAIFRLAKVKRACASTAPVSSVPSLRTGPWAVNTMPFFATAQEKSWSSGGRPTSMTCFMVRGIRVENASLAQGCFDVGGQRIRGVGRRVSHDAHAVAVHEEFGEIPLDSFGTHQARLAVF